MSAWSVRAAGEGDPERLAAWLAPGADLALPAPGDVDTWWVATAADGQPVACARARHAIGLDRPRHWYHVGCVVHAAPELKLFHRQTTLLLGNDHTGASELAEVACDPTLTQADQAGALRAVLQAALRHMAADRLHHPGPVIVELPGLRDEAGRSPFWQGLGRHFFGDDLATVARRHGPSWRGHVAPLLPRQPVYTAFLAPPAQTAIAQVAPGARAWMEVLAHQGFRYSHHVDIIDAGPVFEAHLDGFTD